jgi:hypothetical protein
MFQRTLTAPEIGLIAGTRLALGVGIGLLISSRMSDDQRRAAGWALAVVGGITTIPLIVHVITGERERGKELLPAA